MMAKSCNYGRLLSVIMYYLIRKVRTENISMPIPGNYSRKKLAISDLVLLERNSVPGQTSSVVVCISAKRSTNFSNYQHRGRRHWLREQQGSSSAVLLHKRWNRDGGRKTFRIIQPQCNYRNFE